MKNLFKSSYFDWRLKIKFDQYSSAYINIDQGFSIHFNLGRIAKIIFIRSYVNQNNEQVQFYLYMSVNWTPYAIQTI